MVVTSLCPLFELAAHLDSEKHSYKVPPWTLLNFSPLSPFLLPPSLSLLFSPSLPSTFLSSPSSFPSSSFPSSSHSSISTNTPPFPIHLFSQIFKTAALKYLWDKLFSKASVNTFVYIFVLCFVDYCPIFLPRVNTFVQLF